MPPKKERRFVDKAGLAEMLGVSPRTIDRYVSLGLPYRTLKDKRRTFSVSKARAFLRDEGLTGKSGRPKTQDASKAKGELSELAKADLATKQARAKKIERELERERDLAALNIDERITSAKTFEDLSEVARWVASLVASGKLHHSLANSINGLLKESRQGLKDVLDQPNESEDVVVIVTDDAAQLARVFEKIIGEERRAKVVAYVEAQAELDEQENPNTDPGEGAASE